MAFYGCDFTFDGKKASDFGLMLYNIGSYSQDDVDFSVGEIVEDRISRRYDSLLYGLVQNEPLQFTLVFGMDPDDLNMVPEWVHPDSPSQYMKGDRVRHRGETWVSLDDYNMYEPGDEWASNAWEETENCLRRSDIADITQWLTGHQTYKILKIDQPDMKRYCYHAMVTGLKLIADGGLPVAFSAEITCDSPFAYMDQFTVTVIIENTDEQFTINNPAKTSGFYYPVFDIDLEGATHIEIKNTSDGGRTMRIDDIPTEGISIHIDCQNQTITTNTGVNLYPGFNMKFLRLVPGENNIRVTTDGTGEIRPTCEFPVNIGA